MVVVGEQTGFKMDMSADEGRNCIKSKKIMYPSGT